MFKKKWLTKSPGQLFLCHIVCVCLLPVVLQSCLRFDPNKNCLNPSSVCFRSDTGAPYVVQSVPPVSEVVSVLPTVDVTFSEVIRDMTQASYYSLSGAGATALSVASVSAVNKYTVRVSLNGSVANGPINLHFTELKDLAGNSLSGPTAVTFMGNVNTTIYFDTNLTTNPGYRSGVSNQVGAFGSTDIRWWHDYMEHSANDWEIRLTTGAVDYGMGTLLHSGSNLSHGEVNAVLRHYTTATFPVAGSYRIVVTVRNDVMNKQGIGSVEIVRDDTAPLLSYNPPQGDFRNNQTVQLNCEDNFLRSAYTTTQRSPWAGIVAEPALPADPANPGFTAQGLVDTGSLPFPETGLVTTNPTNPTRNKYRFACIDRGGNVSAVADGTFVIDTTLPEVNVQPSSVFRTHISQPVGTTSTLRFTTNQAGPNYQIVRGGTSCDDGTVLFGPTATPSPAGTVIEHVVNPTNLAVGVNDIRICVRNPVGDKWGMAALQITRDDTAPVVTASVGSGSYGTMQHVSLTCSDNADKVIATSNTAFGGDVPADPADPTFNPDGSIATGTLVTGPFTTPNIAISKLKWRCLDKAGNVSVVGSATYTIDSVLPTVTLSTVGPVYLSHSANPSFELIFSADRASRPYTIRQNNCSGPTMASGTTAATPNASQTVVLNTTSHFTTIDSFDVKVCVANLIGNHGFSSLSVTRDDTAPVFAGITAIDSAGPAGSFTLSWAAATDALPVTYLICESLVANTCNTSFSAAYTTSNLNFTVSGKNLPTIYYYVVRARDAAGNTSTNTQEIRTANHLEIAVSGLNGAITLTNGSDAITVNSDNFYTLSLLPAGTTYSIGVGAAPAGQVCALKENRYGYLTNMLTLNLQCVNGFMVGGSFRTLPAAPLDFLPYRGKVSQLATSMVNVDAIVSDGAYLYFNSGSPATIMRSPVASGSFTTFLNPGTATCNSGTLESDGFAAPIALATDGVNLYIGDHVNHVVYRYPLDQVGSLSRIAGSGAGCGSASGGSSNDAANGLQATFNGINGLAVQGNFLYISEYYGQKIRKLNLANGAVTTVADLNPQRAAQLAVLVHSGTPYLYYTTGNHHTVRRINLTTETVDTSWIVGATDTGGFRDGSLTEARLFFPYGITTDGTNLFITEYGTSLAAQDNGRRVRKINLRRQTVSLLAGPAFDTLDNFTANYSGFPMTGAVARFANPRGITTDGRALYVADTGAQKVARMVDSGLLGYWPLKGNSIDYASEGATRYNGTNTGSLGNGAGRYTTDDQAYAFNGSNTKITAGAPITETADCNLTLALWFNPATNSGNSVLAYNGDTSTSGFGLFMINEQPAILLGGVILSSAKIPVPTNTWTHAALTCTGSNHWTLYLNGKPVHQITNLASSTSPSQFLVGSSGTGEYFDGSLADVRVYNRPLNEGEIHDLAQSASPVNVGESYSQGPTGLLSHYQFTNGSLNDEGLLAANLTNNNSSPLRTGKDGDTDGAYEITATVGKFLSNNTIRGLPTAANPRTLCAWVYLNQQPPGGGSRFPIISYGTSGHYIDLLYWRQNAAPYNTQLIFTGNGNTIGLDYSLPIRSWQHLCMTNDGATSSIYVNGSLVHSQAQTFNTPVDTNLLNIGKRVTASFYAEAIIDDVRIYDKALTAFQVRQLAVQVPIGLMARFDLNGDAQDVSGWGHHATAKQTSGVLPSPSADRFGITSAYSFTGTETSGGFLESATTRFPVGIQNRTACAWFRVASNTTYDQGIFNYGSTSPTGSALGLSYRSNGLLNFFGWNNDLPTVNDNYEERDVWHHLCGVWEVTAKRLYQNGSLVRENTSLSWNTTANTSFYIGRLLDGRYFNGQIDDVRIYNRALSVAEIRVLVTQPNKKMVLSATTTRGNFGGALAADLLCPVGYRAFLNHSGVRRACSNSNCGLSGIGEHLKWVMRPWVTYVRADGTTPIATANNEGIFTLPLLNPVTTTTEQYWTGMAADSSPWTAAAQCNYSVSYWTTDESGYNGIYGRTNAVDTGFIYNFVSGQNSCNNFKHILCVEQ